LTHSVHRLIWFNGYHPDFDEGSKSKIRISNIETRNNIK